jgi:hypothetical protein
MEKMCAKHTGNLRDGTTIWGTRGDRYWPQGVQGVDEETGIVNFSWDTYFKTNPNDAQKTCSFDCETVYKAFADSQDCTSQAPLLSMQCEIANMGV